MVGCRSKALVGGAPGRVGRLGRVARLQLDPDARGIRPLRALHLRTILSPHAVRRGREGRGEAFGGSAQSRHGVLARAAQRDLDPLARPLGGELRALEDGNGVAPSRAACLNVRPLTPSGSSSSDSGGRRLGRWRRAVRAATERATQEHSQPSVRGAWWQKWRAPFERVAVFFGRQPTEPQVCLGLWQLVENCSFRHLTAACCSRCCSRACCGRLQLHSCTGGERLQWLCSPAPPASPPC